jgi:catechol 2,3-dioxygenase-like lactoylglutathione lyase family enzyme
MDASLWNIGMKVKDVEREVAFFQSIGGTLLFREKVTTGGKDIDYALVAFGGTRFFLTPETVFEGKLTEPLQPGLTHAVFEVADTDAEFARLSALGIEVLLPPTDIEAKFGKRRIAFFRSPGGLVFEAPQIVSSTI